MSRTGSPPKNIARSGPEVTDRCPRAPQLNARSARLDEEINLVALDPDLVRVLDAHFDEDLGRSERIVAGRWQHLPLRQRALERGAKLLRREI